MSRLQVFDPPMCCSTGVCGPAVDPSLVRFAADLEWLRGSGVEVERFNLSQEPAAFVGNPVVASAMRGRDDALPLLVLDGKIVAQGAYPGREALAGLVGVAVPTSHDTDAGQPKEATSAAACCPPSGEAPVRIGKPSGASKTCC